jgi:hypothetical protein
LVDGFGTSVAMSILSNGANVVVVGAPGDDNVFGVDAGAVYIYEISIGGFPNWGLRLKKIPEVGEAGGKFGTAVAMDGDYTVVGAPFRNSSVGQAYILSKDYGGADTWGVSNTLDGGTQPALFGQSVSMSGKYVAVGQPRNIADLGTVNIYYNTEVNDYWVYSAELRASDGRLGDRFGDAVGINGSDIVVGAPLRDTVAADAGGAYMFSVGGRKLNSSLSINKVQ